MARNFSNKSPNPSRVRFIMVEAELGDGDIGQITQAIQNALRNPAAPPVRRLTAIAPAPGSAPETDADLEQEPTEENEVVPAVPAATKSKGTRKPPPTPDIVDIDMNADISLAAFAQGKDAKSQHKRYLISAAWLKEHRGIDAVSAGHIYTCFRSMGWPTNILDFWQPLRDLKSKRYFTRNDNNEYEINHIGLAYVQKLGNGTDGTG